MVPVFAFLGLPAVFQDGIFCRVTILEAAFPIIGSLNIREFLYNTGSSTGRSVDAISSLINVNCSAEGLAEGDTDGEILPAPTDGEADGEALVAPTDGLALGETEAEGETDADGD